MDGKQLGTVIGNVVKAAVAPLKAEIVALQSEVATLKQKASGTTIVAHGNVEVTTPGLASVAEAVEHLSAVMNAPVMPIHDAEGKLVGAQRQVPKARAR